LAGLLFKAGVRQLFFPSAERNQFVVELWMPTGTKLEKTNQAILKAEALIKGDKRVLSYATFTGTAAPRFYYNFSPEFPTTNYAQILINTTTDKTAEELAEELSNKVEMAIPEGTTFVKLMQQGSPLKAPVEVRIIGDDINHLKDLSNQVSTIIKKTAEVNLSEVILEKTIMALYKTQRRSQSTGFYHYQYFSNRIYRF
jgi:multidrug efflux pump subunit AcrB